mgnify:FL=1
MTNSMTEKRGIHAARLSESEGLQAIMSVLEDRGWHSAREIREACNGKVEAVSARIQELKANGIAIECKFIDGQYRYRLMGNGGNAERITVIKKYRANSPIPPKWDCWSHLKKEDEQERLF